MASRPPAARRVFDIPRFRKHRPCTTGLDGCPALRRESAHRGARDDMLSAQELVWLMAAVAKGDRTAFERLYAATRANLYGVVLRILRRQDLADEVMQETYLKIWNSAGQFDPALASPITWMVAIARNRAIDLVRRKTEVSIEEE